MGENVQKDRGDARPVERAVAAVFSADVIVLLVYSGLQRSIEAIPRLPMPLELLLVVAGAVTGWATLLTVARRPTAFRADMPTIALGYVVALGVPTSRLPAPVTWCSFAALVAYVIAFLSGVVKRRSKLDAYLVIALMTFDLALYFWGAAAGLF